jgi:hypothetical protein
MVKTSPTFRPVVLGTVKVYVVRPVVASVLDATALEVVELNVPVVLPVPVNTSASRAVLFPESVAGVHDAV